MTQAGWYLSTECCDEIFFDISGSFMVLGADMPVPVLGMRGLATEKTIHRCPIRVRWLDCDRIVLWRAGLYELTTRALALCIVRVFVWQS